MHLMALSAFWRIHDLIEKEMPTVLNAPYGVRSFLTYVPLTDEEGMKVSVLMHLLALGAF